MEQQFQYYKFEEFKGIVMGYPLNPHPMYIMQSGSKFINIKYVDFLPFGSDNTYQAVAGVLPGLYDKSDVNIVEIGEEKYYSLPELPAKI